MLEYDRIDASERTYVNKTNASKECDICRYWYFLNKGFRYGPYIVVILLPYIVAMVVMI